jgi:hypothetical protein
MPRLVKGSKHVYAWLEVGAPRKIAVPEEAITDYSALEPTAG